MLIRNYHTQHLKLMKSFVNAVIQIILHSRMGQKENTASRINQTVELYGLIINHFPDGIADLKNILQDSLGNKQFYLCIELSVHFSDDTYLTLENWILEITPEKNSPPPKVPNDTFAQLHVLLKSIISLTRLTPAYKVTRNIDDSCKICYQFHSNEQDSGKIGNGMKMINLKQQTTLIGNVSVTIIYTNEMLKSQTSIHVEDIMPPVKYVADLEKPLKLGAFVNLSRLNSLKLEFPKEPPVNWLLQFPPSLEESTTEIESDLVENDEEVQIFQMDESIEVEKPIWFIEETVDEQFLNDLNCPFADRSEVAELASFYRKFEAPAQLQLFAEIMTQSPECSEEYIKQKIEEYETSSEIYDKMIEDLKDRYL